ncbi:MAG: radical SAM family heme chaperone HemW [Peptococcales bacterium]
MIEALYIHIPFCQAKCNYCDFYSFSGSSEELQKRYVEALKQEAILSKDDLAINLKSIFFGGGTPTCLSGGLLVHLLEFLSENFSLNPEIEITIEANPGTVDLEKLKLLRKAGANRLSFGVQSFNPDLLKNLGRIHSPQDIYKSFNLAREAGFTNLNFDLMYGLPGQSLQDWEKTLLEVLKFNLEHISLYQLKIEEDTPMGRELDKGLIQEFDDELALEMYRLTEKYLTQAGFIHYEISNYAKPGYQSRHNQIYWRCEPYLGLGVGAHSYLPPERVENLSDLSLYLKDLEEGNYPPSFTERQTLTAAMSETMFMGLRLLEGVNLEHFYNRFGLDARQVFQGAIQKCLKLGLIELENNYLRLTSQGVYLGNLVFEEFLLDN